MPDAEPTAAVQPQAGAAVDRARGGVADPAAPPLPGPPPRPRRRFGTPADMVRSLGLVIGFAVVLAFLTRSPLLFPSGSDAQAVKSLSYGDQVAAARQVSGGRVLAPAVGRSWRATSVDVQPGSGGQVSLHIGFYTPRHQYAELDETTGATGPWLRSVLGAGYQVYGSVLVDGRRWQAVTGPAGERGLLRQAPNGLAAVVVGTAGQAEQVALAGSLHGGPVPRSG